jgi:hypothetical protein
MQKFLAGFVAATAAFACSALISSAADVGPKADVAAVRAAEHQKFPKDSIGDVHVVGNYALLQWYGNPEGSGPRAFKRVSGEKWTNIYADGGVTGVSILVQHGIPSATAKKLCSGWPADRTPCGNF